MTPLPLSPDHVDAWIELRKFAPGAAAVVIATLLVGVALVGAYRGVRAALDLMTAQSDRELEIYVRGYLAGRKSMRRGEPDDE